MFRLALDLGMTLGELQEKMTTVELLGWLCYYEVRQDAEIEARKKADRRR